MSVGRGRRYMTCSREYVLAALADRRSRGARLTSIESVYLDDGGICWLCGRLVEWALPDADPGRPSRDHVVPKSKGGPGLRSNFRLAHHSCNSERGTAPVPTADTETTWN